MADGPAGIGTGLMQGQDFAMQQQKDFLSLAEGKEKLQLTQMQIDQTKKAMQRQEEYLKNLQKLNYQHNAPGGGPASPQDHAREVSGLYYQLSEAALAAGMTEEARNNMETASKLDLNAAHIDEAEAQASKNKAEFSANMMKWVKEAPDQKEAQRRWQLSILTFQQQFKAQSPFAGKPYHPELVDAILHQTDVKKQEAELAEKNAQAAKARAETRTAGLTAELRKSQKAITDTREEMLRKAGGHTKAEVAQADALQDSINIIDDISTIIKQNPDKTLTGLKGMAHGVGESIGGMLGSDDPTPSRDMQADIKELERKMLSATKGYAGKDKLAIIKALADVQAPGMTGKVGERRLAKLRSLLQAQQDHSAVKPTGEQPAYPPEIEDILKKYPGEGEE